mmetsp:Transcript_141631/g.440294  ORF Transcript_141631/g.440294 Transcript_141631/m.440294 type:complete len:288 (-) Transcript_141631:507-1370(-)
MERRRCQRVLLRRNPPLDPREALPAPLAPQGEEAAPGRKPACMNRPRGIGDLEGPVRPVGAADVLHGQVALCHPGVARPRQGTRHEPLHILEFRLQRALPEPGKPGALRGRRAPWDVGAQDLRRALHSSHLSGALRWPRVQKVEPLVADHPQPAVPRVLAEDHVARGPRPGRGGTEVWLPPRVEALEYNPEGGGGGRHRPPTLERRQGARCFRVQGPLKDEGVASRGRGHDLRGVLQLLQLDAAVGGEAPVHKERAALDADLQPIAAELPGEHYGLQLEAHVGGSLD